MRHSQERTLAPTARVAGELSTTVSGAQRQAVRRSISSAAFIHPYLARYSPDIIVSWGFLSFALIVSILLVCSAQI